MNLIFMARAKNKNTRSGQILIEAIVAIGVLTVGFAGILSLLSQTLGLNRVVTDNYIATYLAAEGIEVIKNLIDYQSKLKNAGQAQNFGLPDGCYEVTYDTGVETALPPPIASCDPSSSRVLYYDPTAHLYGYGGGGIPTAFRRTVRLAMSSDGNEITVNSMVYWTSRGGGNFNVNLEDHFMKWEPYWNSTP
jgi:hypothetical protein